MSGRRKVSIMSANALSLSPVPRTRPLFHCMLAWSSHTDDSECKRNHSLHSLQFTPRTLPTATLSCSSLGLAYNVLDCIPYIFVYLQCLYECCACWQYWCDDQLCCLLQLMESRLLLTLVTVNWSFSTPKLAWMLCRFSPSVRYGSC